jgi:hypothetical protein
MIRGCLVMAFLFGVSLLVERQLVTAAAVPYATVIVGVLTMLTTLALGSLQGLWSAWQEQRGAAAADSARWRDGDTVQIDGTLQLTGGTPRGPFTGRPAAYLDYEAWAPAHGFDNSMNARPSFRGFVAAPCLLQTDAGSFALQGMPRSRPWTQDQFTGGPYRARAARHLVETHWTQAPQIVTADVGPALAAFTASSTAHGGEMHLMNMEADQELEFSSGARDASRLEVQLGNRSWTYAERIVPPGERVTVVGTYRANPRRIEIGLSPMHSDHALHVGPAAHVAASRWRSTLAFVVVLAAIALAANAFVLLDGGLRYRQLLEALGIPA